MTDGINYYRHNLRDIRFALLEQFNTRELLGRGRFADWGEEEVLQVLQTAERFAREVAGPLSGSGDRQGCKLTESGVVVPDGFKAAYEQLCENGFKALVAEPEYGGANAPKALALLVTELTSGANTALDMYAGLTAGAAELIAEFGTTEQKQTFCEAMYSGKWAGTMCLTEPQAGSDVGASSAQAELTASGAYRITGSKIFISGGDQDITENIIHLVLARVKGAPAGTAGLTLFIVPKVRLDGSDNDVHVGSIEHKMGLNGSSTCVLNFGDRGECYGEPCGGELGQGIRQMFKMMNFARIAVGVQSLGNASNAYLNALGYACERKQGADIEAGRGADAPKVELLAHPDIRRVLAEMKAKVEGIRALIVKAGNHADQAALESDRERRLYHQGQIEILTPLIKAYASDQVFEIATSALQIYGGAGYTKDCPIEQICRDSKVFSIYEGTNHIQALDLVFRKLGLHDGAFAHQLFKDIQRFETQHSAHPVLGTATAQLGRTRTTLAQLTVHLGALGRAGKVRQIALSASPYLKLMSELCVGWLLLDAAAISHEKLSALEEGHADGSFYRGKVASATYFAKAVLPRTAFEAARLEECPALEPLLMSPEDFG